MELAERKLIEAEVEVTIDAPWYARLKVALWIVLAITSFVFLFVSVKCMIACIVGSSSSDCLIDLQPLTWDGPCQAEGLQCPYNSHPPLLLISVDGFRAEYLRRGLSPTLSKIAQCGVKAQYMFPVYPTKTFPNHYSIVTGLYPSSHGIIDNTMYDADIEKLFKVGKTPLDDPRWWQKEPIWVTAQKQGKKSASFLWPGSNVRINGVFSNIYRTFNKSVLEYPMETRVDEVVEWLSSSTYPDIVTLYLEEPDLACHTFGPNSQQVNDSLKRVDSVLSRLLHGLQSRNLTGCVNILFVSDHGMSEIDCDRVIDIREYINTTDVFSTMGAFGRLKPKKNSVSVDELISNLHCQNKHLRVYKKEELPVRMHYRDNARIEPVILDIDSEYLLVEEDVRSNHRKCSGGRHGYDNLFPDMRAIFFAYGPSFERNITIPPFLNIELYELMCEVSGISPEPNNGTRGSLYHILKYPPDLEKQKTAQAPPVAEVPVDEFVIQSRINSSNCSCFQIPEREIDAENRTKFHLPFGVPSHDSGGMVLLHNSDYVLAYDKAYHIPRWTAFSLYEIKNASEMEMCWTSDVRIENATCSPAPEGFAHKPLHPPQFSDVQNQKESYYMTNSVLKSQNHTHLLEAEVIAVIEKYFINNGPLNVVIGPALHSEHKSYNRKSDLSSLIPNHIFVILTWCSKSMSDLNQCSPRFLEAVSFLLPNFPFPHNCQSAEDTMKRNVARITDIEQITGLSFYTSLATTEAVRLRTSMLHHSF